MSAMVRPAQLWNTMPGWGIAADLTPPELVDSRQLKLLRRLIAIAVSVVVVLCGAGYGLALMKHSSASSAMDRANTRTAQLQRDLGKYAGITQIKGNIAQVTAKVATLMKGDVAFDTLLAEIDSALPNTMAIKQLTVTLVTAGAVAAGAGSASSGVQTGQTRIGTVTLTGSGRTLDDLSTYVEHLALIPGVINVLPTTNMANATGTGTDFSLTFDLTDKLYSHRFDVATTGGN